MRILQQFHKCIAKDTYYKFSRKFSRYKKSISWFKSYIDYISNYNLHLHEKSLSYYWSGDDVDYFHEYAYIAYRSSVLSELPAKIKRHRKFKGRGYAT